MIYSSEIHYTHIKGERNTYNVYYLTKIIGSVRYTPESGKPWKFTSEDKRTQTFGSTRHQAAGFYIEQFMEREEGQ